MNGTMLVYDPGPDPVVTRYSEPMPDGSWRDAVRGTPQLVPRFDTIVHDGAVRRCVAVCDDDGKIKGLPINVLATKLWQAALKRQGASLIRWNGLLVDMLVGPVAVIYGDAEFMESL